MRKSDHISGIDSESREATPLFNPRQDAWSEHFDFDAEKFQLLGRTPKGRATIDQLRMNLCYKFFRLKFPEPLYSFFPSRRVMITQYIVSAPTMKRQPERMNHKIV
jgi:hypothetical protein